MNGVNKIILIGNLGADPETRTTQAGKQVTELRLATSFGAGDDAKTEWHRVVLWDKLSDVASKYTSKGSQVYVEGRLQTRSYEDKDGSTRYVTEVIGQNLTLLGAKKQDAPEPAAEPKKNTRGRKSAAPAPAQDEDDNLFAVTY